MLRLAKFRYRIIVAVKFFLSSPYIFLIDVLLRFQGVGIRTHLLLSKVVLFYCRPIAIDKNSPSAPSVYGFPLRNNTFFFKPNNLHQVVIRTYLVQSSSWSSWKHAFCWLSLVLRNPCNGNWCPIADAGAALAAAAERLLDPFVGG